MKQSEFRCCNCGAELVPCDNKALYICEYCRSVNALTYLPKEFKAKKLERQRTQILIEQEKAYSRFRLFLIAGGLSLFIVTLHLLLWQPLSYANYLVDYTGIFVDLLLLTVSIVAGLFAPVKLYYSFTYERSRTPYNISQIFFVTAMIYDMLIDESAIVRVFLIDDLSKGILPVLFAAQLAAILLIYPAYRSYMGKKYRWMK